MPTIYRSMKRAEDGLPIVGSNSKELGVRVLPNPNVDVDLDGNGHVITNGKGMSVAEHWRFFNNPDFLRALELLRKRAAYINPAVLSSVRGSIWGGAGEDQIAVQFFRRAAQLDPNIENARDKVEQILADPENHSTRSAWAGGHPGARQSEPRS
jgi:hypothetical protein